MAFPADPALLSPAVAALTQAATAGIPDPGTLIGHAVADLGLAGLLIASALRRGRANTDLAFTLVALNLGLFATLVAVSGNAFTSGAGFGLFGMLSLIRLRSVSFTTVDMGYTFLALVIGLLLGLLALPLPLAATLAGALVLIAVVGDHPRIAAPGHDITVILDRVHSSPLSVRLDVEQRLRLPVRGITVQEVDFVREITTVTVTIATSATPRLRRGRIRTGTTVGAAAGVPAEGQR